MEWTDWHEKHTDKIALIAGVDCWVWTGATGGGGYGRVKYKDGPEFAHRAAFMEAGGNFSQGNIVRHKCGVRYCVRPGHLEAGTSKQNGEDTSRMFMCHKSKSMETVLGIRADYAAGMSLPRLARKYGMSEGSVVQIASGRAYSTVAPETAVKPNRFPRKLDHKKADEIRLLISQGLSQSKIAERFGVAQSVISRINTGSRWA
jgi:transposase